jgi:hypothetical protein
MTINGSRRSVDILEIGDLVPFRFRVSAKYLYSSIGLVTIKI